MLKVTDIIPDIFLSSSGPQEDGEGIFLLPFMPPFSHSPRYPMLSRCGSLRTYFR